MPKKKNEEVENAAVEAPETEAVEETTVEAATAETTEETAAAEPAAEETVEAASAEEAPVEAAPAAEEKPKKSKKAATKAPKAAKPAKAAKSEDGETVTAVHKRAEKIGVVASDKMMKSVTVRVDRLVKHPIYRKYVKKRKKFMAHDDLGAKIGDKVKIVETRPLSARKRWRVVEIIQKAER